MTMLRIYRLFANISRKVNTDVLSSKVKKLRINMTEWGYSYQPKIVNAVKKI